jgi:hypothetical protein
MSLSLVTYLVETARLCALYGCRNHDVHHRLVERVEQEGPWEAEAVGPVLRAYVEGQPLETSPAEDAAAGVEILCSCYGDRLPGLAFTALHGVAWRLARDLPGLLTDTPLPLPIAFPDAMDFPTPFYISSMQAAANLSRLAAGLPRAPDGEGAEWLTAALRDYRAWLHAAITSNKDLYLFMY